jgi:hypothetical protein
MNAYDKGQDNDSPPSCPKDRFRQATYDSPRPSPKSIEMTEPISLPKITPETIPTSLVSILTPSDSGAMAAIPTTNSSTPNPITSNPGLQIPESISSNSIDMFTSTLEFAENANSVEEISDPKTHVTAPNEAGRAANEHAVEIHYRRPLLNVRIDPNEEKTGSQIRVDQRKTSTSTAPRGLLRGTMFQDTSDEELDVVAKHRVQKSTNATADMRSDSDSDSDSNDETVTQHRPPRILLKAPAFSAQMSPIPGLRKLLDPVRERHADFLPEQYLELKHLQGISGRQNLPQPEYFTPAELLLLLGTSSKEILPGVWNGGIHDYLSYCHLLESRCQPLLNTIAGRHGLQLTALPEKLLKDTDRLAQPFFLKLSSKEIMYLGHYTLYGDPEPLTEREMKHFVKEVTMKYWAKVLNSRSKYSHSETITEFLYEKLYSPLPTASTPQEMARNSDDAKKKMKGFKSGDFLNTFKAVSAGRHPSVSIREVGCANSAQSGDTPRLQLYWQKLKAIRFDHAFHERLVKRVGVHRKEVTAEAVDPGRKEVKIPDLSSGKKIQEAFSDEEFGTPDPITKRELHAGLSINVPPPTEPGSISKQIERLPFPLVPHRMKLKFGQMP